VTPDALGHYSAGLMEADTVAHCGWIECRATWSKGSSGVLDQIKEIEQALPFQLRGFDCDNGSEFLNHRLLRLLIH
jgi:hypothetical protein